MKITICCRKSPRDPGSDAVAASAFDHKLFLSEPGSRRFMCRSFLRLTEPHYLPYTQVSEIVTEALKAQSGRSARALHIT